MFGKRMKQKGISLIGVVIILALLGMVAVVVMKVTPSYLEYRSILSTVKKSAEAGSAIEAQHTFDRNAAVADISTIGGADLDVEKGENGGLVVKFAYQKKIPLMGPVSLLIDYAGSSRD